MVLVLELSLICLIGFKSVSSFKDNEASYKWSPQYFNRPFAQALSSHHRQDFIPKYSYYGGNSRDFANIRAFPSMTTGIRRVKGSFASWTPEWNRMSSLGSKRMIWKKSVCSKIGETCNDKLDSLTAKTRSPCCSGSTCSLIEGGNFVCLQNPGSPELYRLKNTSPEDLEDLYDYTDK